MTSTKRTSTASTTKKVRVPAVGGPAEPSAGCGNLAVVWGPCSTGVEVRVLASGARLASLSITAPVPGQAAATSVPVTVWDPPAWLDGLAPGDEVVVVGAVRRRFFATASGARGAKVEVEASHVARATPAQRERSRTRAQARLADLAVP